MVNSEDFIAHDTYAFTDRYDGSPDYLQRVKSLNEYEVSANFVEDIRLVSTRRNDFRGKGNETMRWLMAGNSMLHMHISELPPKMYKKAHRHSSDAFILLLSGRGFSVTWREADWDGRVRVDWQAGTLFVPPTYWYHQHLNSGPTPARYLAINVPNVVRNLGLYFKDQLEVDIDEIREEWKRDLRKAPSER
jgi:gentisate 1,2-dioxygenase